MEERRGMAIRDLREGMDQLRLGLARLNRAEAQDDRPSLADPFLLSSSSAIESRTPHIQPVDVYPVGERHAARGWERGFVAGTGSLASKDEGGVSQRSFGTAPDTEIDGNAHGPILGQGQGLVDRPQGG